ncbi:MAG: acetate--CoA ligase family protein [Candidatus Korarchaeota archaeon]|nr:acetate--CoA ligase family protein [Thermoproteota archaeon]MCR8455295.1 acetate--CoA ligase family protein [Thermoproteota archaeon]MCR8462565.1 acetate--CoA ligase family protein [Thermoproteota archaeon]MCR8470707.1 acetate--CoA ligase family protein [Thermoproteota archaeon]MCR8471729.1 acetate--CoA ligase family protein [Thermoproteota archaeon]
MRRALTELEAKAFLEKYGIPFPKRDLAQNENEAIKISQKIGYPVVLKVVSPDIIHKTDVGGVKIGINSDDELREAFRDIMETVKRKKPDARIDGILVEEMIKGGYEVIIGGIQDPTFGPVVMFGGLGGIYVELFKDVTFRLAPIDDVEAEEMIKETKGYQLLKGFRGGEHANIELLKRLLVKTSQILVEHPEIVELDLNPIRIFKDRAVVLDAKILVKG